MRRNHFLLGFVIALLCAACAREDSGMKSVNLRVAFKQKSNPPSFADFLSFRISGKSRWDGTALTDFDCVGVNIMGPGIAASAAAPNQATMGDIINGSRCSYPGVLADTLSVASGNGATVTLQLRAPAGKDRVFQLLGLVNNGAACPTAAELPGQWASLLGVYELGRAKADLVSNGQNIPMLADYAESSAREIRCNDALVSPSAYCVDPAKSTPTTYAGGTGGSPATAYEICTVTQLEYLSATAVDWGAYFSLRSSLNVPAASTLVAIGNSTTYFTGNFDGNGNRIIYRRLAASGNEQGFFGVVNGTAQISDLNITGYLASAGVDDVYGVFAGAVQGGTITDCSATGTVSADEYTGGFVGGERGNYPGFLEHRRCHLQF